MACTRGLQQQGQPQHSRQWGPAGPTRGPFCSGSAGSGQDVGPCGYRTLTGPSAGTTCRSPGHSASSCFCRLDDLHRERSGPHASIPHWLSRLHQRIAAPVESHLPGLGPFSAARVETCVSSLGACVVVRASSYFFRDCTDLTPLRTPDTTGGSCHSGLGQVRSGQVSHSRLPHFLARLRHRAPLASKGPSPVLGPCKEHYFLIVVDDYSRYTTVFPLRRKADVPTALEPWLLARGGVQGLCGLRLHSDSGGDFSSTRLPPQSPRYPPPPSCPAPSRVSHVTPKSSTPQCPVLVMFGGAGGAVAEGEGAGAAGSGGDGSGGAGGVGVEITPVEDTAASTRRPRPTSPPGFSSVPHLPPRSSLRPVAAEPGGGPAGGPRGVGGGGAGSGGAGAGGTGTVVPTPCTIRFLTHEQCLLWLEGEERERFERAQQQQQQQQQEQEHSQSQQQERVEEEPQQQQEGAEEGSRVRLVRGPLLSPPVSPVQTLSSSQWTCRSSLSRAVSPEPRRSRDHTDGPFHLVIRSPVPPPSVLPQPPELSLTVLHDPLCDYLCASRPVVSHGLSALVTHPTAPLSSVSALVTTVAGFASSHHLDYAAHLVSGHARSPSSGGAPVFPLEVLKDRQFELGFLAAAVPHLCAMLLAPEGDPDALDIPIPCNHAEAVSGPWASTK
ncbi:unnamed protein product [Closterium sp. NIES-53]